MGNPRAAFAVGDCGGGKIKQEKTMAIVKQSVCVFCAIGFLSTTSGLVSARNGEGNGNGTSNVKPATQTATPQKTTGAGTGKVKFNEFTIKKSIDTATPRKTNDAGGEYQKMLNKESRGDRQQSR